MADLHKYDPDFYTYLDSFAHRSASYAIPVLLEQMPISSVADFGCGQGAWLKAWLEAEVEVTGVDGPYVDQARLLIHPERFRCADLQSPINLGRRFDLVQSLEVAEHLPSNCAATLVDTLTRHSSLIMFSAAVPGQGGEHHINEQPLGYWRQQFRERGYIAIDFIRRQIASNHHIQPWYRYNILLYADESTIATLPTSLLRYRIADHEPLRNYWPLPDRIRHAMVARLPRTVVDGISRIKARFAARVGVRRQIPHSSAAELSAGC